MLGSIPEPGWPDTGPWLRDDGAESAQSTSFVREIFDTRAQKFHVS